MPEPKHITPQLGRKSAVLLGLMLLATIALIVDYRRSIGSDTPAMLPQSFVNVMWLRGMIYGMTAGACWLATAIQARYLRWLIQAGLAAVFALPLQAIGDGVYFRYFSGLGGMVFFQSMLFFWLRVPPWSVVEMGTEPQSASENLQFGIGEIITATTCVAVLLGIAIRYQPPRVDFASYWLVNGMFWLLAPLMAASLAVAILRLGHWGRSAGLVLVAIMLGAVNVAGLTAAELSLTDAQPDRSVASVYARIIFMYLLVVALFAIAGRLQGKGNDQRSMTNVQ